MPKPSRYIQIISKSVKVTGSRKIFDKFIKSEIKQGKKDRKEMCRQLFS